MTRGAALACYLLLASVYLLYWPHAEFVKDDWFLFHKFAEARAKGGRGELAKAMLQNRLWPSFRSNGLGFVCVYGLSLMAGARPRFYFAFAIALQSLLAYLLYLALLRLNLDARLSFLAGALFLLLPTAHNPLFWFPSCGHYLFSAFWFLIYFHSVAGSVRAGRLRARAALAQAVSLSLAALSGDQIFGLLALAALWLALCWASRAALASAALAWASLAAAGGLYIRFVNRAPVRISVAERFHFSASQVKEHLAAIGADYRYLLGFGHGDYRVASAGWGLAAAVAAGLLVFLWLWRRPKPAAQPALRAVLLGAGMWAAGYGPIWFLGWSELRYHYVPTLGLAIALAGGGFALLGRSADRAPAAFAGLLAAYSAATVVAEIRQCWIPQSDNLRAIARQLREWRDVNDRDIILVAGAPMTIGTAPHFALSSPYSAEPFVEAVTGARGLVTGGDVFCDHGRLVPQNSNLHGLTREDLRRTHLLFIDGELHCSRRTLLACRAAPDGYEIHPLEGYRGSAIEPRLYSSREFGRWDGEIYVAHQWKP
jgi:hypothetical protein